MMQVKLMKPMLAAILAVFAVFGRLAIFGRRIFGAACLSAVLVASALPASPAFAKTDINKKDAQGWTQLHHAIKRAQFGLLDTLIGAKGANPNIQTPKGETALHLAVLHAPGLIWKLVVLGADPSITDNNGWTPLAYAAAERTFHWLPPLNPGGEIINIGDKHGWTALHYAAADGKLDTVQALLQNKANPSLQNNAGYTPLHMAIDTGKGNNAAIIAALVKAGSDMNVKIKGHNLTPLWMAIRWNKHGALDALVKAGADTSAVNEKVNNKGEAHLHLAAKENNAKLAAIFIKAGAKLDAQDADGRTPLHHAAWENSIQAAGVLVRAGAKLAIGHKYGLIPVDMANIRHGNDSEMSQMLRAAGEVATKIDVADRHGWTQLHKEIKKGDIRKVARYAAVGANVNAKTRKGEMPLHIAILHKQAKMVPVLIKAGADINGRDVNDWTPLHYAAAEGDYAAVRALISAGADTNARSNVGWTPLHSAAIVRKGTANTDWDWRTKEKVLDALIGAGADLDLRSFDHNEKPYEMAIQNRGWGDRVTGYLYRATQCRDGAYC